MQTTNKNGNKSLYFIAVFVILLFIVLFFKGCFDRKETVKVTIPEIQGKTSVSKPKNTPILKVSNSTGLKSNYSNNSNISTVKENLTHQKTIDSLLNRNIQLEIAFAKSKNKDSLYKEAIRLNEFSQTWDNDTIRLDVFGISKGRVEAIQAKYKIKERKQEIKVPTTVFRLLGGIETGMTKELSKFNIKASVGVQNKKGDIISAGIDSDQRIYAGYSFSIFSIKR